MAWRRDLIRDYPQLITSMLAVQFYRQGHSVQEVAKAAQVGERTIYRWLRVYGIPLRGRRSGPAPRDAG